MALPSNSKTFLFNETDEFGENFVGDFTVKCVLTIGDKRFLEIEKARIKADVVNPSTELAMMATILSNLRARIIDAPQWWKESNGGEKILDQDVLIKLFEKVMEQEDLWRKELKGEAVQGVAAGN